MRVWLRSTESTMQDAAKLAAFDEFAARMRLDRAPAAPHAQVDNRLGAALALPEQVAAVVADWAGDQA